jgi:hypothetical protein
MTNPTAVTVSPTAFDVLDGLMARVGVDGLTAAQRDPALTGVIDQHGAAVREWAAQPGRTLDAAALASYAGSILAAAARMGRTVPAPGKADYSPAEWELAPWHLLRLVAVCAVALEEDC